VEEVPDTMQWRFDGLTGRALLLLRGRRPRCHQCGDRSHKVATCTATASYASVMRADNTEDDDGDEAGMQTVEVAGSVDVSAPAGPTVTAASMDASESGPETSHNAAVESTLAVQTETAAATDPSTDRSTGSSSPAVQLTAADPPEQENAATSAATAPVATRPSEASDSDISDGDDEMSDLDGGTSTLEAGGPARRCR